MNCFRCHTINEADARFCKNCGMNLSYAPPVATQSGPRSAEDKDVSFFLAYMGFNLAVSLFYLFLEKVAQQNTGGNGWSDLSRIYEVTSWIYVILNLAFLVVMIVSVRNFKVRNWLIIFAAVEFVIAVMRYLPKIFPF